MRKQSDVGAATMCSIAPGQTFRVITTEGPWGNYVLLEAYPSGAYMGNPGFSEDLP